MMEDREEATSQSEAITAYETFPDRVTTDAIPIDAITTDVSTTDASNTHVVTADEYIPEAITEPESMNDDINPDMDMELDLRNHSFIVDESEKRRTWEPLAKMKSHVKRSRKCNPQNTLVLVDTQSCWDEYLKRTGTLPQDISCFTHLNNMNSNYSNITLHVGHWIMAKHFNANYWPAEIIQVCGRILKLQWFGASSSQYFWCDLKCADSLLPLQTSESMLKCPPDNLNVPPGPVGDMIVAMGASFSSAPSPSAQVLALARRNRVEEFKEGTQLDMQDCHDPRQVYRVEVVQCKGGYLLLRATRWISPCAKPLAPDSWVFCTSQLIHAAGWVYTQQAKMHQINVKETMSSQELDGDLSCSLCKHQFLVGMKLELLDTLTRTRFLPATVIQVLSPYYFVIVPDSYSSHLQTSEVTTNTDNGSSDSIPERAPGPRIVCHRKSPGIFPVNWCSKNGLRISPPNGWPAEEEFSWSVYLQVTRGMSTYEALFDLDHFENEFLVDRKLEVVDWTSCERLRMRPATVTRTLKQLVWIRCDDEKEASPTRIYDCRSPLLFPCGWSSTYGIPFNVPDIDPIHIDIHSLYRPIPFAHRRRDIHSIVNPLNQYMPKRLLPPLYGDCEWCPSIYINCHCYCGPHLSSDSIRSIPKVLGPGPMLLVLQKLIKLLISCAYRPKEVLHELVHPPSTSNISDKSALIEVKVRNKIRRFRGNVQVCKKAEDIWEWSTHFLSKLDACPFLFSIYKMECDGQCPAHCSNMAQFDLAVHKPLLKKSCKKRLTKRLRRPSRLGAGGTTQRFIKFRPDRTSMAANLNRKRNKPVAVVEGRRPVTRGIKLPRPDQMRRPGTIDDSSQARRSARKPVQTIRPTISSTISTQTLSNQLKPPLLVSKPLCAVKPAMTQDSTHNPTTHKKNTNNEFKLPPVECNPQMWTVEQLCNWLSKTDSYNVVSKLKEELVDGQAFLLLTIDECRQYLGLKFGPALKLTGIIEGLKQIFIEQFESNL